MEDEGFKDYKRCGNNFRDIKNYSDKIKAPPISANSFSLVEKSTRFQRILNRWRMYKSKREKNRNIRLQVASTEVC